MADSFKNYITPAGYRRLHEELTHLWKVTERGGSKIGTGTMMQIKPNSRNRIFKSLKNNSYSC